MRLNESTYPSYMTLEKGNYPWMKIDAMFDKIITHPSKLNDLISEVKSIHSEVEDRFYLTKPFKEAIFKGLPKLQDNLTDLEPMSGILFTDTGFNLFRWNPYNPKNFVIYGFTREVMTTYGVMDSEANITGIACSVKDGQPYDDRDGLISWVLTSLLAINFIKKCEIEQKVLKPKEKYRDNGQKYYNESKSNVTILDCKWFTELIRDTPFSVKGHLRWQVHGEGRRNRKLIWIDEFQKEGYHRKPQKTQDYA